MLSVGATLLCCLAFFAQGIDGVPICYGDRATLSNGRYELIDGNLEIKAKCYSGYELVGDSLRFCNQELRRYSGTPPTCEDIDECEMFEEGSGGEGWPNDLEPCHQNATCRNTPGRFNCICHPGFYGNGRSCDVLPCSVPQVEHGAVKVTGRVLTITCDQYYLVAGVSRLFCNTANGRWSYNIPKCRPVSRCDAPPPLFNGRWGANREAPFIPGTVISFTCNEGYHLMGALRMKCDDYATWSERQRPFCQETGLKHMASNLVEDLEEWTKEAEPNVTRNEEARLGIYNKDGIYLLFVMDASSSLTLSKFRRGTSLASAIVKDLMESGTSGKVRVAVILYSDTPVITFNFTTSENWSVTKMTNTIKNLMPPGGGTNCGKAFIKAKPLFMKQKKLLIDEKANRVIFLITDGQDNVDSRYKCPDTVQPLKDAPISAEVNVIGIGSSINKDELRRVASRPHQEHLFLLENHMDLNKLKGLIIDRRQAHHKCGVSGNITANEDGEAQPGAWPWYVKIEVFHKDGSVTFCGGSLICKKWVVTAAQCLTDQINGIVVDQSMVLVTLGGFGEDSKDVHVTRIVRHPDYDKKNKHVNDIALLNIGSKGISLGKSIQVICVPKSSSGEVSSGFLWRPNTMVYLTGLGVTDPTTDSRTFPKPHQDNQTIMDLDYCETTLQDIGSEGDQNTTIACLGRRETTTWEGHTECRGDLGGPVMTSSTFGSETYFNLVGIPTYNSKCDQFQGYTVMTNTLPYIAWLEEVTGDCNRHYNCRDLGDGECKKALTEET